MIFPDFDFGGCFDDLFGEEALQNTLPTSQDRPVLQLATPVSQAPPLEIRIPSPSEMP